MKKKSGKIGSSFDSYLEKQGTREETNMYAIKRVIAWQLREAMQKGAMSKNQMAKAMNTSRSQVDRILDPDNDRVQINTLVAAARVLGRELRIELV